jgi:hypothetical protein
MRQVSLLAHNAWSISLSVNGAPFGKIGSPLLRIAGHLCRDDRGPADHAGPDAQFGGFFQHGQDPDRTGQIMLEGQNAVIL